MADSKNCQSLFCYENLIVPIIILLMTLTTISVSRRANAATLYTYDQSGRLTTARYDNGVCVAYIYDANGNRTALNTPATAPQAPVWGTANWGCFSWTPH